MAQTSPVLMHGYMCETRVVAGLGAVSLIEDELRTLKISRPLLVSDRNIAKAQLLEQWLTPALAKLPRVLANVNPDLTDVAEGVKEAKIHGTDGVIIIGGGSTLCLGKAIAIMLTNEGSIADYNGLEKAKRVLLTRLHTESDCLRVGHTATRSRHCRPNYRRIRVRSISRPCLGTSLSCIPSNAVLTHSTARKRLRPRVRHSRSR